MGRAYIWDLDGTLLDSYAAIVDGVYDAYKGFDVILDKNEIHEYVIKYSVNAYIEKMEAVTGLSFSLVKSRYSELEESKNGMITCMEGAEDILKVLKDRGDEHFVFTHRGFSSGPILERLGLLKYFTEVVSVARGFKRKPDPDAINFLLDKYKLDKDNTCYVGDRTLDMDCAHNAGIKGILLLSEGSFTSPNGSETYVVECLADISLRKISE